MMIMQNPFCPSCGTFLQGQVNRSGKLVVKCPNPRCNWSKQVESTDGFRVTKKIRHSPAQKTIVKDTIKQLEELKKKYGEIKTGWACPKCKSFYLTRELVSTRGDEPGKIYTHCLACGHVFKRAIWLNLQNGKEKRTSR